MWASSLRQERGDVADVLALLADGGDHGRHNGTGSEHEKNQMTERETKA